MGLPDGVERVWAYAVGDRSTPELVAISDPSTQNVERVFFEWRPDGGRKLVSMGKR